MVFQETFKSERLRLAPRAIKRTMTLSVAKLNERDDVLYDGISQVLSETRSQPTWLRQIPVAALMIPSVSALLL
jgi:hypothetical protein